MLNDLHTGKGSVLNILPHHFIIKTFNTLTVLGKEVMVGEKQCNVGYMHFCYIEETPGVTLKAYDMHENGNNGGRRYLCITFNIKY